MAAMAHDSMTTRADFHGNLIHAPPHVELEQLRAALEASWDARTAYRGVEREGNSAFGQCYPTSRVVQWFFPECEIATGDVLTPHGIEAHFWCAMQQGEALVHIDVTWRQFAPGAAITKLKLLDRQTLNDSPPTIARCQLLLERVLARLDLMHVVA